MASLIYVSENNCLIIVYYGKRPKKERRKRKRGRLSSVLQFLTLFWKILICLAAFSLAGAAFFLSRAAVCNQNPIFASVSLCFNLFLLLVFMGLFFENLSGNCRMISVIHKFWLFGVCLVYNLLLYFCCF